VVIADALREDEYVLAPGVVDEAAVAIRRLVDALAGALAFIAASPCDPDITAAQCEAYTEHMASLARLHAFVYPEEAAP
jgi:hypothetical protein